MAGMPHLSLAHMGFYVRDLDAMVAFYSEFLGLTVTDRGHIKDFEIAFLSNSPLDHHQVVMLTGRKDDQPSIINQISFRVADFAEFRQAVEKVRAAALPDIVLKDHGTAYSIYFRDPEGNRVEIFTDSPWYIPQPSETPIDMSLSDAEIAQRTEARVRTNPSFAPIETWRERITPRMKG